jgi:hypothetical protein
MTLDLARDIANHAGGLPQTGLPDGGWWWTAPATRRWYCVMFMYRVMPSKLPHARPARSSFQASVLASSCKNRADMRAELNEIPGVFLLQGGLPIRAGGSLIGAVGVSGAPGGEKDEACAAAAIKAVQERLDFAE